MRDELEERLSELQAQLEDYKSMDLDGVIEMGLPDWESAVEDLESMIEDIEAQLA
ncbi:putative DNA-binding protein [Cupriavidus metallidurans]|uniref:hypothetical protein n=1 Tax=Cupriavidus metallidurans TaxID=119219 RepID=UPI000B1AF08C|nr:hypothetical protein [Cupriavidus metallidurans]MDE4917001.1 hypothetical protein [Cupriavidus metallidurans]